MTVRLTERKTRLSGPRSNTVPHVRHGPLLDEEDRKNAPKDCACAKKEGEEGGGGERSSPEKKRDLRAAEA